MAYKVPWGTPERTKKLPPLRPARSALIIPGVAAVTLLLLFALHARWRGVAVPGPLSQAHGASEARCEECHAPTVGVLNQRCQRCHDQVVAERLSHRAHEQAGQGHTAAVAHTGPSCGSCHREHLGRPAPLAPRDDGQCARCHFRGLSAHPEFGRGKEAASAPRRAAAPGFSHRKHIAELAKKGVASADACLSCHPPSRETLELQEIVFDRHCASCHASAGSLGMTDPVPPEDVPTPRDIGEFQTTGGRIVKTVVRHRDPWVLAGLSRLRWQIDPEGAADERGVLEARMSVLRRRLALASPLAGLDLPALEARGAALSAEIAGLEARRAGGSGGVAAALGQLNAAAAAAAGGGGAEADREAKQLQARALALGGGAIEAQALTPAEHDERRLELLVALDTLASVSGDLRLRTEDLRRRVLALHVGESSEEVVARALAERRADERRVLDELELRRSGVAPTSANLLARERRELEDALGETMSRLQQIGAPSPEPAPLDTARNPAASLASLVVRCALCHATEGGALGQPPVTHQVFVRAAFVHRPHLGQATCASCHAGVEASERSGESHLPGIVRCRECHAPGRVLTSCQQCHRYHPGTPQ